MIKITKRKIKELTCDVMIDENKRMQSERNKTHREQFEGERERESRKGANFWKVGVTNVAPTKIISFFSLSGEVR